MSEQAFYAALAAIAVAVLLSWPQFPGALIGFFFGVTIAFFVAGPSFAAAAALQKLGIAATSKHVAVALAGLYALIVIVLIALAWHSWTTGRSDEARLATVKAALFGALPLMGWLSSQALVRAWP